ncbi:MAG: signal recognition particle-docking protein FtsY [Hyphomicrobiaceae bacterium]
MSGSGKTGGLFGGLFGRKSGPMAGDPPVEVAPTTPVAAPAPPSPDPQPGATAVAPPAEPKRSWLQRLTGGLAKTSSQLAGGLTALFTKRKLDADTLQDLEDLLIQADLGVDTAARITQAVSSGRYDRSVTPEEVREILANEVANVLGSVAAPLVIDPSRAPHVILVVGVNGAGKTTTIGKLAAQFTGQGHTVVLAAGDTFRAAAIDQLKVWGERTGCPVIARDVGTDAAGLAFDAVSFAKNQQSDVILIDTAGRLQNKTALMDELDKVVRVVRKIDPSAPHSVLLVLDATTGQNALAQVATFTERVGVTGLIMTKLDGTARGGILVAIAAKFALPIHAIGVGEGVEDLSAFDAAEFAKALART